MQLKYLALTLLTACSANTGGTGARASAAPEPSLTGVEWQLVELDGKPAGFGANGKPATLMLDGTTFRASGYAGCNQFSGTYTLSGASLTFGSLAMTRMYCQQGQALEDAYAKALASTTGQRVVHGRLELLSGTAVVAQFKQ